MKTKKAERSRSCSFVERAWREARARAGKLAQLLLGIGLRFIDFINLFNTCRMIYFAYEFIELENA